MFINTVRKQMAEESKQMSDKKSEHICIGKERNGNQCIRRKRIGNYCWIHNPEDPKICKRILTKGKRKGQICGEALAYKKDSYVTSDITNPDGIFDKECYNHRGHPIKKSPWREFISNHIKEAKGDGSGKKISYLAVWYRTGHRPDEEEDDSDDDENNY
jgi:hypothetical protein